MGEISSMFKHGGCWSPDGGNVAHNKVEDNIYGQKISPSNFIECGEPAISNPIQHFHLCGNEEEKREQVRQ